MSFLEQLENNEAVLVMYLAGELPHQVHCGRCALLEPTIGRRKPVASVDAQRQAVRELPAHFLKPLGPLERGRAQHQP